MNMIRPSLICLLTVLPLSAARGADYTIKAGRTDVSVYFIHSGSPVTPTEVVYTRHGSAPVMLTPSTELAAADSPHADNKWKYTDDESGISTLRYDLPDSVCALGVLSVVVRMVDNAGVVSTVRLDLVGYDPTATTLPANVTQWNGTNVPTSDTAGYPKVTVKDGTGAGEIDTQDGFVLADLGRIAGSADTVSNFSSAFDGSGYGQVLLSTTITDQTSATNFELATGPINNGALDGHVIVFHHFDNGTVTSVHTITNYTFSNGEAHIVLDGGPPLGSMVGARVEVLAESTMIPAIKARTDKLPVAQAGSNGGLLIAGNNADATVNIIGNITGNLSGSVGSVNGTTFESIHLDHLFASAEPGGVVADNSFWSRLLSKSTPAAYNDYNNTTDSLQAQRENLDSILSGAPTFSQAMDAQGYTMGRAALLDNLDAPVSGVAGSMPSLLVSTTIDTLASQTSFTLGDGPPDDDALNGALIIITDQANGEQKAVGLVKGYVGSTRTVTLVTDPGIFTMAQGDKVDVIAGGVPIPLWLGGP